MPSLQHISTVHMNSFEEFETIRLQMEHEIDTYCSPDSAFLTKFAIFEAFNNAIEYGSYPITVTFNEEKQNNCLHVTVSDNGEGFPIADKLSLIENKGVESLMQEGLFQERGRGIYLMFEIADQVIYNEKGNEVLLIISENAK